MTLRVAWSCFFSSGLHILLAGDWFNPDDYGSLLWSLNAALSVVFLCSLVVVAGRELVRLARRS